MDDAALVEVHHGPEQLAADSHEFSVGEPRRLVVPVVNIIKARAPERAQRQT